MVRVVNKCRDASFRGNCDRHLDEILAWNLWKNGVSFPSFPFLSLCVNNSDTPLQLLSRHKHANFFQTNSLLSDFFQPRSLHQSLCISCRVVSCRVVSCRVVSCRVVSCRVVSCRVVSYRIVSCRVVSCRVVTVSYQCLDTRVRVEQPLSIKISSLSSSLSSSLFFSLARSLARSSKSFSNRRIEFFFFPYFGRLETFHSFDNGSSFRTRVSSIFSLPYIYIYIYIYIERENLERRNKCEKKKKKRERGKERKREREREKEK